MAFALLLAAGATLLSASGAQAAKNRGAVLVRDINPARKGPHPARLGANGSDPSGLTNVNGILYFAARDRRHGDELWRSDGTRRGTRMVADISRGRPGSHPDQLTAVGETVYFTARDGVHGPELWRSNGTARSTKLVKDTVPGQGAYTLGEFTNVGGTLFFVATAAPQSGTQTGLWRSNGTAATTGLVKSLGQINYPTAVGNSLYFAASDGTHAGLWRSDGTTSGTVLVKELEGTNICGAASCYLTNVAGTLFFAANRGTTSNFALWRSDGTDAGTVPVKDGLIAYNLTAVGRILYFATRDFSASQLWRSDGTAGGTFPVVPLGPTPEGCNCGLEITGFPQLTNVGGTLFFNGVGGLSRTDGTASGTRALRANLQADLLTGAGHTLYFGGTDSKHGQELWRSDGTRRGTRMVRDIRRGKQSSSVGELTAVGRTLFFRADDGRHGQELWRAGPLPCKAHKKKCGKS